MAEAKLLGVPGRAPKVGEDTLLPGPPANMDPGRPMRDGDRPVGGNGEDERVGAPPEPLYFLCVRVSEKIAWEREDWAFMSVSFVLRIAVP